MDSIDRFAWQRTMQDMSVAFYAGRSGTVYRFDVYPWNALFDEQEAVYVVIRRYKGKGGGYNHGTVVYVGETVNLRKRLKYHQKRSCFYRYRGNAVCVHLERDLARRREMERDLRLAHHPPCNREKGKGVV